MHRCGFFIFIGNPGPPPTLLHSWPENTQVQANSSLHIRLSSFFFSSSLFSAAGNFTPDGLLGVRENRALSEVSPAFQTSAWGLGFNMAPESHDLSHIFHYHRSAHPASPLLPIRQCNIRIKSKTSANHGASGAGLKKCLLDNIIFMRRAEKR